jgi:hypothetical protein
MRSTVVKISPGAMPVAIEDEKQVGGAFGTD